MWPKVSLSLTIKQFLFIQENFHASKSFERYIPLNVVLEVYLLDYIGFILTQCIQVHVEWNDCLVHAFKIIVVSFTFRLSFTNLW